VKVCIIDTGTANLNSVRQALIRLGAQPEVSHDIDVLGSADRLVFPGVGSAEAAMGGVNKYGLADFLRQTKIPLLGICLGMQCLGASSSEVPEGSALKQIDCLGIVPGRVLLLDSKGGRLPHMGWNTVSHADHPLFEGIRQDSYFYFDHSYAMELGGYTIGTTEYGTKFTSALANGTFMGVQFHPEKSGSCGARLLRNFLDNF
jgi:glutamine amidotransferase